MTVSLFGLFACLPPTPGPGTTDLPVPFYQQENYYFCVPAVVKMWRQYKWGDIYSQTQIWNYMVFLGGATPGYGASLSGTSGAVSNYVQGTEQGFYETNQDRVVLRQAVADQSKSIDERQPVIVTTQSLTHVVLLKGVTWHRLSDALQRPNMEYVHLNDPGPPSGGQYVSYTLGEWMNVQILIQVPPCNAYGCVYQWQRFGLKNAGIPGLEQFDEEGGTYIGAGPSDPTGRWKEDGWGGCYWEPNDSGPDQCSGSAPTGRYKEDSNGCYWDPNDSGPDQCVPSTAGLRPTSQPPTLFVIAFRALHGLFTRPDVRASVRHSPVLKAKIPLTPLGGSVARRSAAQVDETSKTATRNGTLIPHPYTTKHAEILENVVAAIRQSHLDEAWNMPELAMRHGELRAGRILDVKSFTKRPDYYVVELVNRAGGLVANIAIHKSGILIGGQKIEAPTWRRPLDLPDASMRAKRFGATRTANYVYMIGPAEVGSPVFAPLAAVELDDGTVYFNSHGEAFAEETSGLAKRVGVQDDKPLPAAMTKLRKLKDR